MPQYVITIPLRAKEGIVYEVVGGKKYTDGIDLILDDNKAAGVQYFMPITEEEYNEVKSKQV